MRPISPSIGVACFQFQCHGSSAISADAKNSSEAAPKVFAPGDSTFRDRNHRCPNIPKYTGTRNTEIPMYWNRMSLNNAPASPIQLCAGREAVAVDAVLNDGSSGLYEASARKR